MLAQLASLVHLATSATKYCRDNALYNKSMKSKVYIETSVISYLTAWPSRDILVAANQQVTQE